MKPFKRKSQPIVSKTVSATTASMWILRDDGRGDLLTRFGPYECRLIYARIMSEMRRVMKNMTELMRM